MLDTLRRTPRTTLVAVTGALLLVALAGGYWVNTDEDKEVVAWLIVCLVGTAIAAVLLLRFVPASESDAGTENQPARRGLILGVLSAITFLAFWSGLPIVLGVPALVLGAEGLARAATQGRRNEAMAAVVLSTLAILATAILSWSGA